MEEARSATNFYPHGILVGVESRTSGVGQNTLIGIFNRVAGLLMPVGIVLGANKDDLFVQYATQGDFKSPRKQRLEARYRSKRCPADQ